ncbi:pentapeptide repeat-containing protein [Streptomyces sp. NPDC056361]|uniref:pentapeptide repeat-containing protein n=1 Tax=Streptomyces sp. NPDC056361 TaxID=3345795 RepID=UPI0035E097C7
MPGLAAVGALLFTWLQVGQTSEELRISEQGQITNRFNAAIGNLGSNSMDLRLGGIYALERIMKDSPPDQSTVVSVLSAYIRRHSPVQPKSATPQPPADIRVAMNILARRDPQYDQSAIDLSHTNLRGWYPQPVRGVEAVVPLREAIFSGADLRDIQLPQADLQASRLDKADLSGADLSRANLTSVILNQARLRNTNFVGANLAGVSFCVEEETKYPCADLTNTDFSSANLTNAELSGSDLKTALFCDAGYDTTYREKLGLKNSCATLKGASLGVANLKNRYLQNVDLSDADLGHANLSHADLRHADLRRANLGYADLSYADLTGADLTGAYLSNATLDGVQGLPSPFPEGTEP